MVFEIKVPKSTPKIPIFFTKTIEIIILAIIPNKGIILACLNNPYEVLYVDKNFRNPSTYRFIANINANASDKTYFSPNHININSLANTYIPMEHIPNNVTVIKFVTLNIK